MKTALFFKSALVLPMILLADYVIMVLLGCASCLFGVGNDFYCGTYCIFGKLILLASAIFFGYLLWRDYRKYNKAKANGKAA